MSQIIGGVPRTSAGHSTEAQRHYDRALERVRLPKRESAR